MSGIQRKGNRKVGALRKPNEKMERFPRCPKCGSYVKAHNDEDGWSASCPNLCAPSVIGQQSRQEAIKCWVQMAKTFGTYGHGEANVAGTGQQGRQPADESVTTDQRPVFEDAAPDEAPPQNPDPYAETGAETVEETPDSDAPVGDETDADIDQETVDYYASAMLPLLIQSLYNVCVYFGYKDTETLNKLDNGNAARLCREDITVVLKAFKSIGVTARCPQEIGKYGIAHLRHFSDKEIDSVVNLFNPDAKERDGKIERIERAFNDRIKQLLGERDSRNVEMNKLRQEVKHLKAKLDTCPGEKEEQNIRSAKWALHSVSEANTKEEILKANRLASGILTSLLGSEKQAKIEERRSAKIADINELRECLKDAVRYCITDNCPIPERWKKALETSEEHLK